jgi:hypothetical protein
MGSLNIPLDTLLYVQSFLCTEDVCNMFSVNSDFLFLSPVHPQHELTIKTFSMMGTDSMVRFRTCDTICFTENNISPSVSLDMVLRDRIKILNLSLFEWPVNFPLTLSRLDVCVHTIKYNVIQQPALIELNILITNLAPMLILDAPNLRVFRCIGDQRILPNHTEKLEIISLKPRHFAMMLPCTLKNLKNLYFFDGSEEGLNIYIELPSLVQFYQEVDSLRCIEVVLARQAKYVQLDVNCAGISDVEMLLSQLLARGKIQHLVLHVQHLTAGTIRLPLLPPLNRLISCHLYFGIDSTEQLDVRKYLEKWIRGLRGGTIL